MAYSDARGIRRLQQLYDLVRYKIANQSVFADVKYRSFCLIRAALEQKLGTVAGKRLLEIGCGQWQTNVLLFAALGADVIGVDPEAPPSTLFGYAGFAAKAGLQRAAKTALNEALFRSRFNRRLGELSGLNVRAAGERVLRQGGERLPFADGRFDAVFSDDVFEHLPQVEEVTAEIARVLKPGGAALVIIHPFTAYSGGHHPATMDHGSGPSGTRVPAWDHLRARRFPSGVFLNGLREGDYRRILGAHLEIDSWTRLGPEGEPQLTPEVLAELDGYGREELLVGKIVCLARNPTRARGTPG